MKKAILILSAAIFAYTAQAQKKYEFTETLRLWAPEVQNQGHSGTCWCFSTLSFLESEMKANGATDIPNLSEMFIVRQSYIDKARKYVYMHGNTNFSEGGFFYDNIYVFKYYGLMPESAYPNTKREGATIMHGSYSSDMKDYVDSVANDKNKTLNPAWLDAFTQKTDKFFGEIPESFTYNGNVYTPMSFAKEVVKLNPDDYIQVTSFNHHPFYQNCILELPDNWRWSNFYNVPINDLITIIDNSLAAGHTVVWSTDVSEKGFEVSEGYAVLQKDETVTQESRQKDFESRLTTDDHGMQIIGTATDKSGKKYYIVKNSWGDYNKYGGYLYASEDYVKAKTTGILVNKTACGDILNKAE